MTDRVVGHLETALATMPLAEGFQTQVRTFQPGMGNTQLLNLSVVGKETVETPAGSFDTYRVDF